MADITVTGSADFTKVTAGIRRLGAETDAMKKKSGSGGMAILEISRGLEDLQYGIKGVVNNIPTMLTALGVGAGLAGVASIAVVGVYQLVGWLDKLLDKMNEANDAKFAGGFGFKALSGSAETMAEINRQIDAGAAKVRNAQDAVTKGDTIRGTNQSIRDSKLELELAEQSLQLLKEGKTEEEAKIQAIDRQLTAMKAREQSQKDAVEAQRTASSVLEEQIQYQLKVIENFDRMKSAAEEARRAAIGEGLSEKVKQWDRVPTMFGSELVPRDVNSINNERQANVKGAIAAFESTFDFKALRQAEVAAGIAKKALEDLRARRDASQDALFNAEQENKQREQQLTTAKRLLEIEQERAEIMNFKSGAWEFLGIPSPSEIQEMRDLLKANDEAFSKSLDSFKINGDGLLSSQGRIGGSGDEFRSSVATINYQRETLSELRKIANNTRNRTSTYR